MNDSLSPVDSDEIEMESDIPLANLANLDVSFLPNVAIAEPAPDIPTISNTSTVASIDNTTTTIVPGSNSDSNSSSPIIERILVPIPSDALTSAAQAAKIVSAIVKPVPWLGPAVELVAAIVTLCQNVGKNRGAAAELAEHCQNLLDVMNERFPDSSNDSVNGMLHDLTSLLSKIKTKLEEWQNLHFIKAVTKQKKISEGILSFHVEIDQFCRRYAIVTQTLMVNWIEIHEKQSKADMDEIRSLFVDYANKQTLEHMAQTTEIAGIRADFQKFLYIFQDFLLQSDPNSNERRALEENISAMCRSSGEIPPDVELTEGLLQRPKNPEKGSTAFDIYRGFVFGDTLHPCAIKVVRHPQYNERTKERFKRQLQHWKSVNARDGGKHILPLICAVFRVQSPDPFLCFVSPWMENGNALEYVKKTDDVNRIKFVRHIAEGVKVLHTHDPPLVHCFLKSSNILINKFGEPLIADFGLLRIIEQEKFSIDSCPNTMNAFRYLAPEMIAGVGYEGDNAPEPTDRADIFMFAMTILELMTQKQPYAHLRREPEVLHYRSLRGRPIRPTDEAVRERGLGDQLWTLLNKCWSENPWDQPTINDVLLELETLPSLEED